MSCGTLEGRIALLVEGDLPAGEVGAVEAHLAGCAVCRCFAEELRESQRDLRSLAEQDLDGAALANVRRRVREVLDRRGRRPVFVALAAAAGVVAVAFFLSREDPGRPPAPPSRVPPATATRPAPAEVPAPPMAAVEPERRAAQPASGPLAPPEQPTGRVAMTVELPPSVAPGAPPEDTRPVIKVVTSDPDVVIYWVTDPEGGPS